MSHATSAQRTARSTEFRTLLVRTCAAALTADKNQKVSFLPMATTGDEIEVTVQSEIEQAGGLGQVKERSDVPHGRNC